MVNVPLVCPFCGSDHVGKTAPPSANNAIFAKTINACSKHSTPTTPTTPISPPLNKHYKQSILKWSGDSAGVRAISRQLGVSQNTVIAELKKKTN